MFGFDHLSSWKINACGARGQNRHHGGRATLCSVPSMNKVLWAFLGIIRNMQKQLFWLWEDLGHPSFRFPSWKHKQNPTTGKDPWRWPESQASLWTSDRDHSLLVASGKAAACTWMGWDGKNQAETVQAWMLRWREEETWKGCLQNPESRSTSQHKVQKSFFSRLGKGLETLHNLFLTFLSSIDVCWKSIAMFFPSTSHRSCHFPSATFSPAQGTERHLSSLGSHTIFLQMPPHPWVASITHSQKGRS